MTTPYARCWRLNGASATYTALRVHLGKETEDCQDEYSSEEYDGHTLVKRRLTLATTPELHFDCYFGINPQADNHLTGLVVLRVSFPAQADAQNYQLPAWMKELGLVCTDVTSDTRYSDEELARYGRPAL